MANRDIKFLPVVSLPCFIALIYLKPGHPDSALLKKTCKQIRKSSSRPNRCAFSILFIILFYLRWFLCQALKRPLRFFYLVDRQNCMLIIETVFRQNQFFSKMINRIRYRNGMSDFSHLYQWWQQVFGRPAR